jgi:hypothetical protein
MYKWKPSRMTMLRNYMTKDPGQRKKKYPSPGGLIGMSLVGWPRIKGEPVSVVSELRRNDDLETALKSVAVQTPNHVYWHVFSYLDPWATRLILEAEREIGNMTVMIYDLKTHFNCMRNICTPWVTFHSGGVEWEPGHLDSLVNSKFLIPNSLVATTFKGDGYVFRCPPRDGLAPLNRPGVRPSCTLYPTEFLRRAHATSSGEEAAKAVDKHLWREMMGSTGHYTARVIRRDR